MPLGRLTSNLAPRERLLLLADVVVEWERNEKVRQLPSVIEKILGEIGDSVDKASAQRLAVELAITEYLRSPRSNSIDRIGRFLKVSHHFFDF